MNDERFEELLAGYIAGELDEAQTAALRTELEADPQRRRLALELQAAAAALETNALSDEQARARIEDMKYESLLAAANADRDSSPATPIILRHRRHWAVLRYAAVIALAFGAGFFTRGREVETSEPAPTELVTNINPQQHYINKYVKATRAHPKSSSFSRSLIMLARQ